jgi:hypothetical protein
MARELKVWGGMMLQPDILDRNDRAAQLRSIVVAYTKKEAMRLLAVNRSDFSYWTETGNPTEIALIKHGPGVWRRVEKDQWRKIYRDGYERVARYG